MARPLNNHNLGLHFRSSYHVFTTINLSVDLTHLSVRGHPQNSTHGLMSTLAASDICITKSSILSWFVAGSIFFSTRALKHGNPKRNDFDNIIYCPIHRYLSAGDDCQIFILYIPFILCITHLHYKYLLSRLTPAKMFISGRDVTV